MTDSSILMVGSNRVTLPGQLQGKLLCSQLESACKGYKLPKLCVSSFEDSENRSLAPTDLRIPLTGTH